MRVWLALVVLLAAAAVKADDESKSLTVRILGPEGTAPAQVFVEFECPNLREGHLVRGSETTKQVAVRRCTVRARHARDASGALLPWAPTRLAVGADVSEVVLRMGPALSVEGRVVDEAGRLVAGLPVYAADPADGPVGKLSPLASARTGQDGRFLLSPLGEEPFDIATLATQEFPQCPPVRLAGGARDVVLTVHRVGPIEMRTVDGAGNVVARARVVVWTHTRTKHQGSASGAELASDDEGRLDLPAMDPRLDLSLEVTPPQDREDLSLLKIDPWRAVSGDVVIPPGFTAILHVKDEDGRVREAEVTRLPTWEEAPMGWTGKRVVSPPDEEGRVVLRSLPYGTSRFSARALDGRQVWPGMSPWIAVTEGNREIDLVIPSRPRSMRIRVEDPEPGQQVHLFAESDGRDLQYVSFVVQEDGVVRKSNVAVGEYSVYAMACGSAEKGGRAGLRGRFLWDGETEVVVPTGPPAIVHVRAKTPPDGEVTSVTLYVNGTISVRMQRAPEGTWVAEGLPAGRYGVVVEGRRGQDSLRGQGYAKTGEVTEIALEED